MDTQSKPGNQSLQFPGIAVVVLALGLILIPDTPFKPTRPSMSGGQKTSSEDVRSRMWQDPFAAVALHRKKYHSSSPSEEAKKALHNEDTNFAYYYDQAPHRICNTSKDGTVDLQKDAHSIEELRCQMQRDTVINPDDVTPDVHTLAVMVPGGPYAEDAERRLRSRYAVVSALANTGYVPEDAEHIGYLEFARECQKAFTNTADSNIKLCDWPAHVPYEWFEKNASGANSDLTRDNISGRVLVLWLDNDSLARDRPLNMLGRLRNSITPGSGDKPFGKKRQARVSFNVLGPTGSGTLEKMYSEIIKAKLFADGDSGNKKIEGNYKYLEDSIVFSSQATVETDTIINNVKRIVEYNDKKDINIDWLKNRIARTINTDDQLAKTLICELTLRGIFPFKVNGNKEHIKKECPGAVFGMFDRRPGQHHIALIGEWDTLYSRNLTESILQKIAYIGNTKKDDTTDDATEKRVHSFNYLRGLDGVNADAASSKSVKSNGTKKGETEALVRRPIGPNQFDYLRRIAGQISHLNNVLSKKGGGSVKAIGILGSDDYDKLLILQALRKQFPGVLFFTTDLDARLLHPAERDWARNLIVASSYGLALNDHLQMGAPPFRDNYQTALYFTTMEAVKFRQNKYNNESISKSYASFDISPRLFEVGHNGAVDISHAGDTTIHQDREDLRPKSKFERKHFLALIALFTVFLLYQAGPNARKIISIVFVYVILLGAAYQYGVRDFILSDGWKGESFSFTNGTSVWPANFVRLLAAIIAVTFIIMSIRKLRNNSTAISIKYGVQLSHKEDDNAAGKENNAVGEFSPYDYVVVPADDKEGRGIKLLEKIKNIPVLLFIDLWGKGIAKAASVKFEHLWSHYMALSSFSSWIVRVLIMLVLYILCASILLGYFEMPNIPFRGEVSYIVSSRVLLVAVFAYLFLIFLVVDVTRLNDRFVRLLTQCNVIWPESVIDLCCKDHGIPKYVAKEKILLDLVVKRAGVVDTLIFYPFFILFLMIISRSHYFDNWQLPVQLAIFIGFTGLIAIGSAVRLRSAAQIMRRTTLNKLQDYYCQSLANEARQNNSETPDPEMNGLPVRIKLLIDDVKEISSGPFSPLSRHPIVRAIAMPFGGVGGLYLIDYLTAIS